LSRWRLFGGGLLAIIVFLALIVTLTTVGLVWRYVIAEPRGKVQQEEIIQEGQHRIAAYDRFFNLCAQVQSDEATIVALQDELKTNPPESRITQINASITALRSGRAEKINQYNVDARKEGTSAQFRSDHLPFQLDITQERTLCTV
jgi:hypothetical protein